MARVIRRRIAGGKESIPFHYREKGNFATVGRSFAIADLGSLKLSGFLAWVAWLLVHISYLIGFCNRLLVMMEWAWAYRHQQPCQPKRSPSAYPHRASKTKGWPQRILLAATQLS